MNRLARIGIAAAALLFSSFGYSAKFHCSAIPQDSVHIKPRQIEVYGASGSLVITPEGDVTRNGAALSLSSDARAKAKVYQSQLRKDLPYIYNGVNQQIDSFYSQLDLALSKKLGKNSKTRNHLSTMKQQLSTRLNQALTPTKDGMLFNAESVKTVEQEGRDIIQNRLGAIMQDGINELGSQGMQGLLGGLDGLQDSMRQVWRTQQHKATAFANDACGRVRSLEDRRLALIRALP